MAQRWENLQTLNSKSFVCGYCDSLLAANLGYYATKASRSSTTRLTAGTLYICHKCSNPTYFDDNGRQFPGAAFGDKVLSIPSQEVESLYDEARNCMKVGSYTASVMCCRKLLMNVSIALGAKEGQGFWQYVEYLRDSGYLPVNSADWLKYIKDRGNEANHEIKLVGRADAEQLIEFSALMLKLIYEYPAKIKQRSDDAELNEVHKAPNINSPGIPPTPQGR